MKIFSTICLFLVIAISSYAQKMASYNLSAIQGNFVNPAATATQKCTRFRLTDKHQWIGMEEAPSLQTFSVEVPKQFHKYKKHGLGLNVVRDKNGAVQSLSGEFIYSFHIQLGRIYKHYLSFGISANFAQNSFDESNFTREQIDPIITFGTGKEISYNASAGIYYYGNKAFGGVAVLNLLPTNTNLYYGYGNERFFLTSTAGIFLEPRNDKFILKSWLYGCKGEEVTQIDFNNVFTFPSRVSLGLTLRKYLTRYQNSGQNALVLLGYEYNKWNVNYSYDLGLNKLQYRHTGSHMVSLGYKICRDKYACPTYKK